MNKYKLHIGLCYSTLFFVLSSCVEPFEAETLTFENVLVIDARITDEFIKHEVILRRSYPFEEGSFEVESNAVVQIVDEIGTTFDFQETDAGKYKSNAEFAAQANMGYQLLITTKNGKSYQSEMVNTPASIPIKEFKAELGVNDAGTKGLHIALTNETANTEAKYFRYEYEETYKIVAPYYNPLEFDIIDSIYFGDGDFDTIEIGLKARTEESRVCYNTLTSKDLVLSDSQSNIDNQTTRKSIRFLEYDDFKISHRYTILVKQFGLTQEAYSYYKNLDDFTSSESVFNENQPGFLAGNVKSLNGDDAVLGYFEVAALNENRYFFSYNDFFTESPLPPYVINCNLTSSPQLIRFKPHVGPDYIVDSGVLDSPLLDGIQAGVIAYFEINEDYEEEFRDGDAEVIMPIGPFYTKATPCIDCRVLGSNIKPDFWIED